MYYWNHNAAYYKWIKKQVVNCHDILDVGCGDGSLAEFLFDENKKITGIDSYNPCIIKAQSRKLPDTIDFFCEDENVPVSYNFPTMKEIRTIKKELLNDSKIKYGLFYRYLIKWEKV